MQIRIFTYAVHTGPCDIEKQSVPVYVINADHYTDPSKILCTLRYSSKLWKIPKRNLKSLAKRSFSFIGPSVGVCQVEKYPHPV